MNIGSLILIFIIIEWLGRKDKYAIETMFVNSSIYLRWTYYLIIADVIFAMSGEEQQFIGFQF